MLPVVSVDVVLVCVEFGAGVGVVSGPILPIENKSITIEQILFEKLNRSYAKINLGAKIFIVS